MSKTARSWSRLGEPAPESLGEARLELHWAAQAVSSVGRTWLEARIDDSHTNLEWLAGGSWLATGRLTGTQCSRAALRPADFTIHLLDSGDGSREQLALDGSTLDEACDWLSARLAACRGNATMRPLESRGYELPEHPIAGGQAFCFGPAAAFEELGRWYDNVDLMLRALAATTPGSSPVRCWPHHFDIATLITLAPGPDAESPKTIGVGMTPGDGTYPEPYLYVTPWPYPADPALPGLDGGGRWHREGWLGAVLGAADLVAAGTAGAQEERARTFIGSALAACRTLLGG